MLMLPLRTRDKKNQPGERAIPVEGKRVAIVVMDMWNSHWDATYTARSAAIVPGMNQFLHDARAAGSVVIFSPTVMIEQPGNAVYGGTRQRAAVKEIADAPLPPVVPFEPAEARMWLYDEIGMDGKPAPAEKHSGWGGDFWPLSAQCPGLDIEQGDYFIGDGEKSVQELWNVMRKHGIEHVLYLGGALNMCLYGKPIGVYFMKQRGVSTVVVRGLTEGWSAPRHWYRHEEKFPQEMGAFSFDTADEMMVQWYERNVAPSTSMDIFPRGKIVRELPLANATAIYSAKGFEAGFAIDGSPLKKHGWGNEGNPAKDNALLVRVADGANNPAGEELVFVLDFLSHMKKPGLGKFRLSATANAENASEWIVLKPVSARTLSVDSQLEIKPDESLLVQARKVPDFDRYVVRVKNPLGKKARGFRLETMGDENFVLSGLMVRSIEVGTGPR